MVVYLPLNSSACEVRMLNIVETPEGDLSGLVHCVLATVSLNDLTSHFTKFLKRFAKGTNISDLLVIDRWLKYAKSCPSSDTIRPLSLSLSRQQLQEMNSRELSSNWESILSTIGVNKTHFPVTTQLPRYNSTTTQNEPKRGNTFNLVPRFTWGDYEAVSYCWESEEREKCIILDGAEFAVPRNLEAMLQKLKHLPDVKSGMKLWIDSLCIDQANIQEKNEQLQLMQSIYQNAFSVIVWLGPESDQSDHAAALISRIVQYSLKGVSFTKALELDDSEFMTMSWQPLLPFLRRNYWRRLWIIQELALNHNMTLFLCGNNQLSRSMIFTVCKWCRHNSETIDSFISGNLVSSNRLRDLNESTFLALDHVFKLVTMSPRSLQGTKINLLLDVSRTANVKNPLDKVYGILGLLPDELSQRITPDYKLSQLQVYSQFSRELLNHYKNLHSLLSWCSFELESTFPSWVPDWTSRYDRNHRFWLWRFNTSSNTVAQWSTSKDHILISCKGLVIDKVHNASTSLPSVTGSRDQSMQSNNANMRHGDKRETPHKSTTPRDIKSNRYGDEKKLAAALARTLLQNHPHKRHEESPLHIPWLSKNELDSSHDVNVIDTTFLNAMMGAVIKNSYWGAFNQFRQTNKEFSIFGHYFKDFFPNKILLDSDLVSLDDYDAADMQIMTLSLVGRKIVTTETGFVGMVPDATQAEDIIAILYGCNFPVVLRQNGPYYWYIGECYVDGIMYGEAFEEKMRGEWQEVELTLC